MALFHILEWFTFMDIIVKVVNVCFEGIKTLGI